MHNSISVLTLPFGHTPNLVHLTFGNVEFPHSYFCLFLHSSLCELPAHIPLKPLASCILFMLHPDTSTSSRDVFCLWMILPIRHHHFSPRSLRTIAVASRVLSSAFFALCFPVSSWQITFLEILSLCHFPRT